MSTTTITQKQTTERQSKYRGLVPILKDMNALVVGCGSLGSHLIAMLSRMQPQGIMAVDMDDVAPENLGVQDFTEDDIGYSKANALFARYGGNTPIVPYAIPFKQFAENLLSHRIASLTHVFMCVDNMETRKEIWEAVKKWNGIVVDGRLDSNTGWVYTHKNPNEWYRKTLYPDSEVIATGPSCAVQMTGYSAHVVAGIMVAQAMRFSQDKTLDGEKCGIDLNNMLFFPVTT